MQKKNETGKRTNKRYEELEFTDDFMFCKILQNNPELCKEMTELIIGRKIGRILNSESQKPIEITADGKGVRFDVYLEDDTKTVYDIEMETTTKKNLPKRARYYQAMIDLNIIERGADYTELRKSYVIFICLKNPYAEAGLHKYTFETICREIPELTMGDEVVKVFLAAEGSADDVSEEMKAFLDYLAGKAAESRLTQKLDREVRKAREHKQWRQEYMTLLEKYREEREAGREEGLKAGREEGLKAGREEGLKAGREEGLRAGLEAGELCKTVSVIDKMLQKNRSIEEISELTGEEIGFVQKVRDLISVQGTEYDPGQVMKKLLSSTESQE